MDREHIIRAMIARAYFISVIPYFFIVHEVNNLPQVEEFRCFWDSISGW